MDKWGWRSTPQALGPKLGERVLQRWGMVLSSASPAGGTINIC